MFIPLTPVRFLYRAMDLFANRVGIVCGDKRLTYGQFGERACRLANALLKLGVKPGDRVAYLSFNTHQLMEGYYGVVMAHGIVMPINVRLSPVELTAVLNHSGASILLFEAEFAPLAKHLKASCPALRHLIAIDGPTEGASMTAEELYATGEPDRVDFMAIDEMSIAELFYTSGSTGTPKGVSLSHRTIYLHAVNVALLTYRDISTIVDLHTIPLFHANGWGKPQASVLNATHQVMVRRFEPVSVLKIIAAERATDMSMVPTMANAILHCPELGKHDTSTLKQIMIGGAAASPELIQRLEAAFNCEVVAGYGLTETSPVATTGRKKSTVTYPNEMERYRRQSMAGWAANGVEVRVVDLNGKDVPKDMEAIGEVIIRGDHVMEGYYNEPEATASVIVDGWFHSGDMAIWDSENYVHIVDRKKEIIISGGENISSIEVEKAIYAHPAVFECAVVAAPDPKWGEVPAAIVVRKPGASVTSDELMTFLEERLGRFKLPRIIEFSEEQLPKTGTGKIRKNVLKERFWQGKEKRVQG